MSLEYMIYFVNENECYIPGDYRDNDTLPGGNSGGSDTFFFGRYSDGPVPDGTFGEPLPDPHPTIDPYADDDAGTVTGPFEPVDPDDNGTTAEESDGNTLHPDHQPVEEVWIFG